MHIFFARGIDPCLWKSFVIKPPHLFGVVAVKVLCKEDRTLFKEFQAPSPGAARCVGVRVGEDKVFSVVLVVCYPCSHELKPFASGPRVEFDRQEAATRCHDDIDASLAKPFSKRIEDFF
jgi:hypothetical protein